MRGLGYGQAQKEILWVSECPSMRSGLCPIMGVTTSIWHFPLDGVGKTRVWGHPPPPRPRNWSSSFTGKFPSLCGTDNDDSHTSRADYSHQCSSLGISSLQTYNRFSLNWWLFIPTFSHLVVYWYTINWTCSSTLLGTFWNMYTLWNRHHYQVMNVNNALRKLPRAPSESLMATSPPSPGNRGSAFCYYWLVCIF